MAYTLNTGEQAYNSHAAEFDAKHDREGFWEKWDGKTFHYDRKPGSPLEDILYGDGCDDEQKISGWFIIHQGNPWGPYETEAEAKQFAIDKDEA